MSPGGTSATTVPAGLTLRPSDHEMRIGVAAGHFINGLVFFSPVHADDAPGDMIVNRRRLAGQPNERHNGEAAIRLHVQNMLPVLYLVGFELLGGEEVLEMEIGLKEIGHGAPDSFGIGLRLHDIADGCNQPAKGWAGRRR